MTSAMRFELRFGSLVIPLKTAEHFQVSAHCTYETTASARVISLASAIWGL